MLHPDGRMGRLPSVACRPFPIITIRSKILRRRCRQIQSVPSDAHQINGRSNSSIPRRLLCFPFYTRSYRGVENGRYKIDCKTKSVRVNYFQHRFVFISVSDCPTFLCLCFLFCCEFRLVFCRRSVTILRSISWPTRCALEREAVLFPGHLSNTHVTVPVRRRLTVWLADWRGALPGQRHRWVPSPVCCQLGSWIIAALLWSSLRYNKTAIEFRLKQCLVVVVAVVVFRWFICDFVLAWAQFRSC